MGRWKVESKPVPENPTPEGKNESGVVVTITDGNQKVEVSRVLFVRRNARNKSVGFKRQLLKELDKAYDAVEVLNDSYLSQEQKDNMKAEAVKAADEKREKFLEKLANEETPRV
jgi:hypothetical protein